MAEEIDERSITEDLGSGDPARVDGALRRLDAAWRVPGLPVPVPAPEAECLEAFGDDLPEEVVLRFIRVVLSYPIFEPPPDPGEEHGITFDAALRYGGGQPVFEAAMGVRIDDDPAWAVPAVVKHLNRLGLESDRDLAVVEEYLGYLLDSDKTYAATVAGLEHLAFRGSYLDVLERLLPRLTPAERLKITEIAED